MNKVLIIAEAGVNHNGSLKIANGVNSTQFTVGADTNNIPLAAMV